MFIILLLANIMSLIAIEKWDHWAPLVENTSIVANKSLCVNDYKIFLFKKAIGKEFDLLVRVLDPNNQEITPEEGVLIDHSTEIESINQYESPNNKSLLTWISKQNNQYHHYGLMINYDGSFFWPSPVILSQNMSSISYINMQVAFSDNGSFFMYHSKNDNRLRRIGVSGNVLWQVHPNIYGPDSQHKIIFMNDILYLFYENNGVSVSRYSPDGYSIGPLYSIVSDSYLVKFKVISLNSKIFVVWNEYGSDALNITARAANLGEIASTSLTTFLPYSYELLLNNGNFYLSGIPVENENRIELIKFDDTLQMIYEDPICVGEFDNIDSYTCATISNQIVFQVKVSYVENASAFQVISENDSTLFNTSGPLYGTIYNDIELFGKFGNDYLISWISPISQSIQLNVLSNTGFVLNENINIDSYESPGIQIVEHFRSGNLLISLILFETDSEYSLRVKRFDINGNCLDLSDQVISTSTDYFRFKAHMTENGEILIALYETDITYFKILDDNGNLIPDSVNINLNVNFWDMSFTNINGKTLIHWNELGSSYYIKFENPYQYSLEPILITMPFLNRITNSLGNAITYCDSLKNLYFCLIDDNFNILNGYNFPFVVADSVSSAILRKEGDTYYILMNKYDFISDQYFVQKWNTEGVHFEEPIHLNIENYIYDYHWTFCGSKIFMYYSDPQNNNYVFKCLNVGDSDITLLWERTLAREQNSYIQCIAINNRLVYMKKRYSSSYIAIQSFNDDGSYLYNNQGYSFEVQSNYNPYIKLNHIKDNYFAIEFSDSDGYFFNLYSLDENSSDTNEITNNHQAINIYIYPNPFNPVTNISFETKSKGITRIDIFNVKGQKVKTILNETIDRGNHIYQWDGTDHNRNISSGVYFCRIKTENSEMTKKLVLIK